MPDLHAVLLVRATGSMSSRSTTILGYQGDRRIVELAEAGNESLGAAAATAATATIEQPTRQKLVVVMHLAIEGVTLPGLLTTEEARELVAKTKTTTADSSRMTAHGGTAAVAVRLAIPETIEVPIIWRSSEPAMAATLVEAGAIDPIETTTTMITVTPARAAAGMRTVLAVAAVVVTVPTEPMTTSAEEALSMATASEATEVAGISERGVVTHVETHV